jgi:hypothetical protein
MWGLCHALDGYMPTSHNKGPSLILGQPVWNLRWTKRHWKRFSPRTSVFPYQYNSTTFINQRYHTLLVTDSIIESNSQMHIPKHTCIHTHVHPASCVHPHAHSSYSSNLLIHSMFKKMPHFLSSIHFILLFIHVSPLQQPGLFT